MRALQIIIVLFAGISAVIGWLGLRDDWLAMIEALKAIDAYITENAAYPGLFAIGVGLLLGAGVLPEVIRYLIQRFFHKPIIDQFAAEFDKTSPDRLELVTHLSRLYREWKSSQHPERLSLLLETIPVPADLPLDQSESLLAWSLRAPKEWYGERKILWDFLQTIYPAFEDGESKRENLRLTRQTASKFWNKWGGKVLDGDIKEKHIKPQLISNLSQLKLLCHVEAAQVLSAGWDEGPGKSSLFELAHRAQKYVRPRK